MLKIFPLFFLLFSNLSTSQEKIVAEVGDRKIYESEFKERFDFSVHPRLLQKSDKQQAKLDFLHQLIAEKLLSINASEKGCDTLEVFRDMMIPLENMFIRDALYTSEIKNKISYSSAEIDEGMKRIRKALKLKFIHSPHKQEIDNTYSLLMNGASFDSILSLRKEANNQDVPREVTFGTMDKSIEDHVYSLKTGEFTPPLQSEDGFYILKLISAEVNPSLKNYEMTLDEVKRIVHKRAEYKRYKEFHGNTFKDEKITADKEIFNALALEFVKRFKEKYSGADPANIKKFSLIGTEIRSVSSSIQPDLFDRIFINLENPVNLKPFLHQLTQEGFYVRDISDLSVRSSLSSYIRKFIEDQILTEEGKKNGMINTSDVKKYTSMWKDYYLSKIMMIDFFDSIKVSGEAYSLYEQNKDSDFYLPLVNIAEVLTDSLSVVETVLNELSAGKNIKYLARKYTKRDSLREKGGEFGYFPVTQHGELGKIASRMSVGEVYGPVKLDEGYSVFQLLDKKTDTSGYKMDYMEVKDQVIMMLTLEKFEKFVNDYNARLAFKYGVKIYEDALKDIENSFLNLIVVRYMGFGGEILAVPFTEQFSGWYKIWQETKGIVQ